MAELNTAAVNGNLSAALEALLSEAATADARGLPVSTRLIPNDLSDVLDGTHKKDLIYRLR